MKKVVAGLAVTLAIVGLVALFRYHPNSPSSLASNPGANPVAGGNVQANVKYKDGSYTGQTVDVGYGPVQVKAVVSGGKIADVVFLQMPGDVEHSVEVTNMAEPILRSETLQSQSANVDIASGATQTSEGYIQSLQDALSQATN